jgi:hypothetical protein
MTHREKTGEFIENPETYPSEPDIVLELSGEAWAKVYLSAGPIEELINAGEIKVTKGDAAATVQVL